MCSKIKRRKCYNYEGCQRGLGKSNRSGYCYYHYKVVYSLDKKGESLNTIEFIEIQNE